jgi:flagellar basal-body rod protein FlgB
MDEIIEIINENLNRYVSKLEIVTNNIANIETPNYKRREIVFEDVLEEAKLQLRTSNEKHIKGIKSSYSNGKIITDQSSPSRADGNNVVLEKEIKDLNEIQLMYQALIKMLNYVLRGRKISIGGK